MGPVVCYVSGCWDLFHVGHLRRLERAKAICDILVVGVNTDEMIEKYKGEPPIIPYEQRKEIIEALRCVDVVVPHCSTIDTTGFEQYDVTVRVVGADYDDRPVRREVLEEHRESGIEVVIHSRTPEVSTTTIKEKIRCLTE